jgi:hypothetical protein
MVVLGPMRITAKAAVIIRQELQQPVQEITFAAQKTSTSIPFTTIASHAIRTALVALDLLSKTASAV